MAQSFLRPIREGKNSAQEPMVQVDEPVHTLCQVDSVDWPTCK